MQSAGTPPRTAPAVMDNTQEEEDDFMECTPPDIIIPQQLFAVTMQSAGTTPRTAPEIDNITDATKEMSPVLTTPPRKKNRINQFTPSTGIIQSTVTPQNVVPVEFEFLGFTPSSTTSKAAPGSGGSAYELDIEREFMDHCEGSERRT